MTPMTKREFGKLLLPLLRVLAKEQEDINKQWEATGRHIDAPLPVKGIGIDVDGKRILFLRSNLGTAKRNELLRMSGAVAAKYAPDGELSNATLRDIPFILYGGAGCARRIVWGPDAYPIAWWDHGRIVYVQERRTHDMPTLISFLEARIHGMTYKPLAHEF
jgi:hypothetical protein